MYGIVAGLVVLGTLCGATVRLLPFVIILIGAAIITVLSTCLRGDAGVLLNAVFAVIALQAGYAAGIVLRAMLRSWRRGRTEIAGPNQRRSVHRPTEQKHR